MARFDLAAGQDTTNRATYTVTIAPTAKRLVLAFVMNVRLGNAAATEPALTGNGLTWVKVASLTCGGFNDYRLTCFRAMGAAPAAGLLTMAFAGETQSSCAWSIVEYDDVDITGADGAGAVIQAGTSIAGGSASVVAVGLAPFQDAVRNVCVGGAVAAGSTTGLGQGTGLTEIHAQIIAETKAGSLDTQERTGQDLAVTWTMPSVAAGACAIALEIKVRLAAEVLARRFEPILFFHPLEPVFPCDAKRYVEHCALWRAEAPTDQKDSWGGKGSPFPRQPLIEHGKIAALSSEPGTFLGVHAVPPPSELRFLELGGWKDKTGASEPGVTQASANAYTERGRVVALYNAADSAGGNATLRGSRFWYHAELFENERLRRLLATVRAPDLVRVLDDLQRATLLCYYLFFPAHEESLTGPCTNVEAAEFGSFGGDWACVAILLEQGDDDAEPSPSFIGYSGRRLPPAGVAQTGWPRGNMKVSRFTASDPVEDHAKLYVARGTHGLYLEPGPQGVHAVGEFVGWTNCGVNEVSVPSDGYGFDDVLGPVLVGLGKIFVGGVNFGLLGAIAGAWWFVEENDFGEPFGLQPSDTLAPDQGPVPGDLGTVVHPAGVTVDGAGPREPWTSARGVTVNGRRYDFVVDRSTQVWWPSDPGDQALSGYQGAWGPSVANDPYRRRAGMEFPRYWEAFFLALADGKAQNLF